MVTLSVSSMRPPYAPSPLAGSSHSSVSVPAPIPRRHPHFAQSRPLRPFASISQTTTLKPVKIIEPPQNFTTTFILNLTQEELSRQD